MPKFKNSQISEAEAAKTRKHCFTTLNTEQKSDPSTDFQPVMPLILYMTNVSQSIWSETHKNLFMKKQANNNKQNPKKHLRRH